ncbi:short-chain dehydrogenase [Massilia sp. JS1662]|nr:SDR family oxidoreductase [Massilia sp. JS1662]KGF80682.1 short-chain dehydrogenase [Massilia sp. JS1662]
MTVARSRRLRVFITGASSGIGAALAREYAARGAVLGLLGRRADALHALPFSGDHHIYTVDVTDHAALAAAANDFIAREGGADVVIASAGVSAGTLTEGPDDLADFARIFDINVTATVATFAPFVETMKRDTGPRRLVAIGSVAGIRGMKGAGAYCASKSAVHTYAESLRLELQPHGIRVVTIAPGYIDTPMTRQNRFPMPFLMPVDRFAAAAARAIDAGTSYRVIPWPMGVVAKILRLLPNVLFDALFAHAPTKSGKAAP